MLIPGVFQLEYLENRGAAFEFCKSKSFIIDRHSYHIWWAVLFLLQDGQWQEMEAAAECYCFDRSWGNW